MASRAGRNILSKHMTSDGPKVILEDSCQSEIDLIHFDHAKESRMRHNSQPNNKELLIVQIKSIVDSDEFAQMKKEIETHQRFRGNIKTSTAEAAMAAEITSKASNKHEGRILIKSMQNN